MLNKPKFSITKKLLFASIFIIGGFLIFFGLRKSGSLKLDDNNFITQKIGPEGGIIEVNNLSSPLDGVRVELLAGSIEREINITVRLLSEQDKKQQLEDLPEKMRFFGGVELISEITLKKPVNISLPNNLGASKEDQLLVGELVDLDGDTFIEVVYKGMARIGSPLTFAVPNFGSFVVLSPSIPLQLVEGNFVNQSANPIPDGIIATRLSKPFVTTTEKDGHFIVPAGPANSFVTVLGIPPAQHIPLPIQATQGIGITEIEVVNLPWPSERDDKEGYDPPDLPKLPDSPPDKIPGQDISIVTDKVSLMTKDPSSCPCACPSPPSPEFASKKNLQPPFDLYPEETARISITNIFDTINDLWSGLLCFPAILDLHTSDKNIAIIDSGTRVITAVSPGKATLNGEIQMKCIQSCCEASTIICPFNLTITPAEIRVGLDIINESPKGLIKEKRAIISAKIISYMEIVIDRNSIKMTLDGNPVTPVVNGEGSEINFSYQPIDDLTDGKHTVMVQGSDVNKKEIGKEWTFRTGERIFLESWATSQIRSLNSDGSGDENFKGDAGTWSISTWPSVVTGSSTSLPWSEWDWPNWDKYDMGIIQKEDGKSLSITTGQLREIKGTRSVVDRVKVYHKLTPPVPVFEKTVLIFTIDGQLKTDYGFIGLTVTLGGNYIGDSWGLAYAIDASPDLGVIRLPGGGGTYTRNLLDDLRDRMNFIRPNLAGVTVSNIQLEVYGPGQATFDNIAIE